MIAQCPSQMRHHHVRFPHRLQSRTDAQRKTVRLGKSRGTGRHCRCKQHRKSALPTTMTCESCHSHTRNRPDDGSFLVRTWTRRTAKQCFQQLTFCFSSGSDWDLAKNNSTADKATQCRTMSRNVWGSFSEADPSASLGSCVPEGDIPFHL